MTFRDATGTLRFRCRKDGPDVVGEAWYEGQWVEGYRGAALGTLAVTGPSGICVLNITTGEGQRLEPWRKTVPSGWTVEDADDLAEG